MKEKFYLLGTFSLHCIEGDDGFRRIAIEPYESPERFFVEADDARFMAGVAREFLGDEEYYMRFPEKITRSRICAADAGE